MSTEDEAKKTPNDQENKDTDNEKQEEDGPEESEDATGGSSASSRGSEYVSPPESINSDPDPPGLTRGRTAFQRTAPKRITYDELGKPKYEPRILHVEAGCTLPEGYPEAEGKRWLYYRFMSSMESWPGYIPEFRPEEEWDSVSQLTGYLT